MIEFYRLRLRIEERSILIAYVTKKDVWIQALVERRGKECAAVALANKTVRTAFAMLTQGTEYKAEYISA